MSEPGMEGGGAAPAAPAGGSGELATYGQRILAYIIDGAIIMGIFIVGGIVVGILSAVSPKIGMIIGLIFYLVIMVGSLGYMIYFPAVDNGFTERGQTPGKKFMKIKIVKQDGSDFSVVDAIIRLVGYACSGAIMYLGFIWIFIDDDNQGWHDKIAKTRVIQV